MINELVTCDVCGIKIPKENRDRWHNLNIVRHLRSRVGLNDRDMNASFHVCTDDLKNILFEVLGANLSGLQQKTLTDKIAIKLRLTV